MASCTEWISLLFFKSHGRAQYPPAFARRSSGFHVVLHFLVLAIYFCITELRGKCVFNLSSALLVLHLFLFCLLPIFFCNVASFSHPWVDVPPSAMSLSKFNNLLVPASFLHSITSLVALSDPSKVFEENNHSAVKFLSFRAEISLSCVNAVSFYQLSF